MPESLQQVLEDLQLIQSYLVLETTLPRTTARSMPHPYYLALARASNLARPSHPRASDVTVSPG